MHHSKLHVNHLKFASLAVACVLAGLLFAAGSVAFANSDEEGARMTARFSDLAAEAEPMFGAGQQVKLEVAVAHESDTYLKGVLAALQSLYGSNPEPDAHTISAEVRANDSDASPVKVRDMKVLWKGNNLRGNKTWDVSFEAPSQIDPGKYTVVVTHTGESGSRQVIEQDFTWGVLALNTAKSSYLPGEEVTFEMGVLDDVGEMDCRAELELAISGPFSAKLSTKSGTIAVTDACQKKSLTREPDFVANWLVPDPILGTSYGEYEVTLTARTDNGVHVITDSFRVYPDDPLVIERSGPTRIYPPLAYPVTLNVTARQDFSGVVTEYVPESFSVTPAPNVQQYESQEVVGNGLKRLTWKVAIKQGERVTLGYRFDAPDVSPQFYLTGPLTFTEGDTEIFREHRQWQIAGDAITFSRVQSNVNQGSPASATFDSAPTENNLLVAIAHERSGTPHADFSISGTGWTKRVGRDIELTNANARHTFIVWTKTAGASDPTNIQVSGGGNTRLMIQEFSAGSPDAVWSFLDKTENDSGTSSTSPLSTGNTGTVQDGDLLLMAAGVWRNGSGTVDSPAWTNGLGDILHSDGGTNSMTINSAFAQTDTGGTKESTVSWDGSGHEAGAALLVFGATDASATITVSGTAYEDDATTPLADCDDTTPMITLRSGTTTYGPVVCDSTSGAFTFDDVTTPAAGDPLIVYIDGAASASASAVTRYAGINNVTDVALRKDRLVMSHQDTGPVTNADAGAWDNSDASGVVYSVDGSNNLTLEDGIGILVADGETYTPGATLTTFPASSSGSPAGDVVISSGATLSMGANNLSIGGSLLNSGTLSVTNDQTTTFTAVSPGHIITTNGTDLGTVTFNGSGGGWSFSSAQTVNGNLNAANGTLSGSGNITVLGDVTGSGGIQLSGGTFTHSTAADGSFGSSSGARDWSFNNLTFTNSSEADRIITLDSGGTGTIEVSGNLAVGGVGDPNTTHVDNSSSDRMFVIGGDFTVLSKGKFSAGSGEALTVSGDFTVNGTFVPGTGTVTFNDVGQTSVIQGMDKGASAWFDSDWLYRKRLVIDASQVPTTETDFPMLVSITGDTDLALNAQDTFDDVVFTSADGTTQLSHELTTYDGSAGTVEAWVKIPSLDSTTNTEIYLYYGNSTAPNQENVADVWSNNYAAVYHLEEDPSSTLDGRCGGGVYVACDSSGNGNHLQANNIDNDDQQTGKIGSAVRFNNDGAEDEFLWAPSDGSLEGFSSLTVSAWVNAADIPGSSWGRIVHKANGTDGDDYALLHQRSGPSTPATFRTTTDTINLANGTTQVRATSGWHLLHGVWNGSLAEIYNNATQEGSAGTSGALQNAGDRLAIGNHANDSPSSRWFNGAVDEVRVQSVNRSAGWITAEYNNQNDPDAFYTVSAQQTELGSNLAFYNLSSTAAGKTLRFTSGQTFGVSGNLNLVGQVGSTVRVDATNGSQQWLINHQGTETLSYVTVRDSGCDPASSELSVTNGTNDGNNGTCWVFSDPDEDGGGNNPGDEPSPSGGNGNGSDSGQETSSPSESDIVIDAQLPVPTLTFPVDQQRFSESPVVLRGTGEPNAQVEIYDGDTRLGSSIVGQNGTWSFTLDLIKEEYELRSRVCFSQRCSNFSETTTIFFDDPASVSSLQIQLSEARYFDIAPDETIEQTVMISGGERPYQLQIDWGDGKQENQSVQGNNESITFTHAYAAAGTYDATVTVSDAAGAERVSSFSVAVQDTSFWRQILPAALGVTVLSLVSYGGLQLVRLLGKPSASGSK